MRMIPEFFSRRNQPHEDTRRPDRERPPELRWLDFEADSDIPPPDWAIPILEESPTVTEVRNMEGGPWYLMPDSGEQVPPDFYADIDKDAARRALKVARQKPAKMFTPDGKAVVPADVRELLKKGGLAGDALLKTLERGLEATTYEIREAANKRLRRRWLSLIPGISKKF